MRGFIVLCLILALATFVGGCNVRDAYSQTGPELRQGIRYQRDILNGLRENRCYPPRHFWRHPNVADIPRSKLGGNLRWITGQVFDTMETRSICRRETKVIRVVFPDATEDRAISVARCESHLDRNARNPSGASGLFQLMPIHWRGKFDPFDPLLNSLYARKLSHGGTYWVPWECA